MFSLLLLAFNFISENALPKIGKIEHSTAVVQGEALYIQVELSAAPKDKVHLTFLEREVPCYNSSNGEWECYSAVPADAKTGEQKIKISANNKVIKNSKVQVRSAPFPTEPLRLDEEKKSLLVRPDRKEEVKKIRSALSTETSEKLWGRDFLKPLEGGIESNYGEKRTLEGKLRKGYHRGVDLGAPEGSPILAAHNGKVVLTGEFAEEGNMVMVDHGQGILTVYMHCSAILVSVGQSVRKGELIGKVGSTGVANTPHLHFGIYIHGVPIDPLYWLSRFQSGD